MSTGAIAGVVVVNAATANAVAQAAALEACKARVIGYQHQTATVEEKRSYADCIKRLHPNPMTEGEAVAVKAAIAFCILAFFAGCVYGWLKGEKLFGGSLRDGIVWGVVWLLAAVTVCIAGPLVVKAVLFLFS